MTTRILSVFNLLKRVGLAFLLLGGGAFAQPQPEVIWDRSGLFGHSRFGTTISSLGDQNDDGFSDWAVSAPAIWDDYPQESYAELFFGGNPPSSLPYRRFTTGDTLYNVAVAKGCGDLNGDGFIDYQLLLWPIFEDILEAHFYFGGVEQDTLADFVHDVGYQEGFDGMGDFNGDGYDDLIFWNLESPIAKVFFGGNPMDFEPDWVVHDDPHWSYSSVPESYGDLNGDGFADILSYFDGDGQKVWFGSVIPDTIPQVISELHTNNSIREIVDDLNGDGRDEFLVPHPQTIDVYFGGEALSLQPDYILQWPEFCDPGDLFSAGDFNRDGANDLIAIGTSCASGWGRLGMYLGYHWINPNPIFQIVGRGWQNLIGIRTACALGDVNGDGIDDVGIGANNGDADGYRGRAIIIAGSEEYIVPAEDSHPEIPIELPVTVYPNPFNAVTTVEFHMPQVMLELDIVVFNTLGQEVRRERFRPVSNSLRYEFFADNLPSGLYLLTATTGDLRKTTKLMLIK